MMDNSLIEALIEALEDIDRLIENGEITKNDDTDYCFPHHCDGQCQGMGGCPYCCEFWYDDAVERGVDPENLKELDCCMQGY